MTLFKLSAVFVPSSVVAAHLRLGQLQTNRRFGKYSLHTSDAEHGGTRNLVRFHRQHPKRFYLPGYPPFSPPTLSPHILLPILLPSHLQLSSDLRQFHLSIPYPPFSPAVTPTLLDPPLPKIRLPRAPPPPQLPSPPCCHDFPRGHVLNLTLFRELVSQIETLRTRFQTPNTSEVGQGKANVHFVFMENVRLDSYGNLCRSHLVTHPRSSSSILFPRPHP